MGATKKKPPEVVAASRKKSNENLKKGVKTQFKSGDPEARKAQSKGGKRSQQVRREERSFRSILEMVWGSKPQLSNAVRDQLIHYGMNPETDNITNAVVTAVALSQKAQKGDTRAAEKVLEVLGQDPKMLIEQQKLEVEKESLKQGISGYSALDDAFAQLSSQDGSDAK